MINLSLKTARNLQLAAQGLLHPADEAATPERLLAAIRKMSLLQIDTIHVVARSPWLVLFSRIGSFPLSWLEQALRDGALFEYWAHEACFIPIEDYPLLRHRMLSPASLGWKFSADWMQTHQTEIADLLAHIEQAGPVRAADFAAPSQQKAGWWAWKPHKRHLENLFTAGELMVSERRNFQRVYDLRQRVLPGWHDDRMLSETEAVEQMLRNSANSLGIFRPEWLADYYRLKKVAAREVIARWLEQGVIIACNVETLGTLYLHHALLPLLEQQLEATHSTVLSPFDPLVWHRKRALELFDFDYRLECYTPEAKRHYGYFVLPILLRGELKARMDAKMIRKSGVLQIKNLWLEPGVPATAALCADLKGAIDHFARWQGADSVQCDNLPVALTPRWQPVWSLTA